MSTSVRGRSKRLTHKDRAKRAQKRHDRLHDRTVGEVRLNAAFNPRSVDGKSKKTKSHRAWLDRVRERIQQHKAEEAEAARIAASGLLLPDDLSKRSA